MWVPLSLTCHIKDLSLSLSVLVVVIKRKKDEKEDKVENDIKQKNR